MRAAGPRARRRMVKSDAGGTRVEGDGLGALAGDVFLGDALDSPARSSARPSMRWLDRSRRAGSWPPSCRGRAPASSTPCRAQRNRRSNFRSWPTLAMRRIGEQRRQARERRRVAGRFGVSVESGVPDRHVAAGPGRRPKGPCRQARARTPRCRGDRRRRRRAGGRASSADQRVQLLESTRRPRSPRATVSAVGANSCDERAEPERREQRVAPLARSGPR